MDVPPTLLSSLPSLSPLLHSLRALLSSPYPPRSIYLRATSNLCLIQPILEACLAEEEREETHAGDIDLDFEPEYNAVQRALPRYVFLDCAEIASQKALFGRILNGLSGWGQGEWDDSIGGVVNWDGKQEGYTMLPSEGEHRRSSGSIKWDYRGRASTSAAALKGIMGERKDESMSGFLDGLRSVFSLGSSDEFTELPRKRQRPRFVVLHNAEKLPGLESLPVGQTEGTLLACFMRLGELTRKPIVPILVSSSEWLLLRPQRGATEPAAMLEMPSLAKKDVLSFLPPYLLPSLPQSPALSTPQHSSLLTSLVDLLHQTFSPYLGSEMEDYIYLIEKLWPTWLDRVVEGQVEVHDTGRMVALLKGDLVAEIEGLAELRPMAAAVSFAEHEVKGDGVEEEEELPRSPTKTNGHSGGLNGTLQATTTPTKSAKKPGASPLPGFAASPSFYSPSSTPSKRNASSLLASNSTSNNSTSLPFALPLLSRYILISAFLASSNPSRKDLQMLATESADLFSSRKRKKGGGTRKTPNKKTDGQGGAKKEAMPQRLLGPKPFPVERLVAIAECILPLELRGLAKSPDMLQEISTLTNLRLLLKTSSGASSSVSSAGTAISAFDKLDGIKLKCSNALELELVEAIGKSVGFKVSERLWEAM